MNQFTAALAEQRRTDLMASAQRARDYRRAKSPRTRTFRMRLHGLRRPVGRPMPPLVQLPDAL
jgi:hypothetical protein